MFHIENPNVKEALLECNIGLEKECLRVTSEGRMAQTPHPFEQQIYLNHHKWDNDFSKVSKSTLEAELSIPKWRLDASFGYALVANMLYYDTEAMIRQHDGVVNVSDVVKAVSDGKTQAEIDAIVDIIMGRK